MNKQTSVTLLRLVGSIVGLLAIIAVICLLGLLYLTLGMPHPETHVGLLGITAVVTLSLCGLTALLFHKAHTVDVQLSLAEQSAMAIKRNRREYILFAVWCFGLSGLFSTYSALHNIYGYYADHAFAKSVSPTSFWIDTLLEGAFGIFQLLVVGSMARSARSTPSGAPTPID